MTTTMQDPARLTVDRLVRALAPRPMIFVFPDLPGLQLAQVEEPATKRRFYGLSIALFRRVQNSLMADQLAQVHQRADVQYVRGRSLIIPVRTDGGIYELDLSPSLLVRA